MCYLGGSWRRLEQLERIYGRFPSVDQSGRFASWSAQPCKPLYREKCYATMPMFADTHISSLGYLCSNLLEVIYHTGALLDKSGQVDVVCMDMS